MVRALTAFLCILFLLNACTQRTVCPAFQSAYIYDKNELRKKFSYIKEDSTPKIYSASKTKYLIAEPTTYRKKTRSLKTVPVRPIYVAVPDSFNIKGEGLLGEEAAYGEDGVVPGAELDLAARSVIDSIYIEDVPKRDAAPADDSVYVISRDREVRVLKYDTQDSLIYDEASGRYVPEKPRYAVVHVTFNVDQDNYMWYLRDYLVLPDVRQARIIQMARQQDAKAAEKKKKREGGFFRNLFRKKKKEEPEEQTPRPKTDEDEFDFIDEDPSDDVTTTQQETRKEKKGLFRRKSDKSKKEKPPKKTPPVPPADIQDEQDEKVLPEKLDQDGF